MKIPTFVALLTVTVAVLANGCSTATTQGQASAQTRTIFTVTDPRDLKLLQIAEGAKMDHVTLHQAELFQLPPKAKNGECEKVSLFSKNRNKMPPPKGKCGFERRTFTSRRQPLAMVNRRNVVLPKPQVHEERDSRSEFTSVGTIRIRLLTSAGLIVPKWCRRMRSMIWLCSRQMQKAE